MDFRISCDANAESKLDQIKFGLNEAFAEYFGDRFYDDSGVAIFLVLTCRDPSYILNQRIRFSKKENCLYMDLMFDLHTMINLNLAEGRRIVGDNIVKEVPQIIAQKNFKGFDLPRFSRDLREWFEKQGWIPEMFSDDEVFIDGR